MTRRNNPAKNVLVTGAGSGLGQATAKMLKKDGWNVFGTLIEGQSEGEARGLGIIPLVVDIADRQSVEAARRDIDAAVGPDGLAALVNVAGVAAVAGGVIEGVSEERTRALFDVNVFGTLNAIQVFLPLLRRYGPARIVNVASSGVRVPTAFSGIYSISKYATEGITNALRYELPIFGIEATSIEPGAMATPMTGGGSATTEKTWDPMPDTVRDAYYDKLNPSLEFMNGMISQANPPEDVAKVILKALKARKMKIRYIAGKDVRLLPSVQRLLGENAFEKVMLKVQKIGPR